MDNRCNQAYCGQPLQVTNIADGSGNDDSWDVLTNGQVVASCRYVNNIQTVAGRAVAFVPKGIRVKFTLGRIPVDQEAGTDEYRIGFELAENPGAGDRVAPGK